MLKELIKVIQQEQHSYKDPITEFIECLYVNYDFEGAQNKLRECEDVSCSTCNHISYELPMFVKVHVSVVCLHFEILLLSVFPKSRVVLEERCQLVCQKLSFRCHTVL